MVGIGYQNKLLSNIFFLCMQLHVSSLSFLHNIFIVVNFSPTVFSLIIHFREIGNFKFKEALTLIYSFSVSCSTLSKSMQAGCYLLFSALF
jgi:hypothetical protein